MSSILTQLEDSLAEARRRVREIKAAIKEVRRLEGLPEVDDLSRKRMFKIPPRATAIDAIKIVLTHSFGEPLHYRKLFLRARMQGYSSGREDGGTPATFWNALKKNPHLFEAVGKGKYKLKEGVP